MNGAIGLLIWSVILVASVDNLLRPKFIEKDVELHPFLILLSAVGGIRLFGPLGFLIGPLVLSLLFTLIDIYESEFREYLMKEA
jgi:predicted PurR-regulated permease PerM